MQKGPRPLEMVIKGFYFFGSFWHSKLKFECFVHLVIVLEYNRHAMFFGVLANIYGISVGWLEECQRNLSAIYIERHK